MIKSRLQTSQSLSEIKNYIAHKGIKKLWTGGGVTCAAYLLDRGIWFSVYEKVKVESDSLVLGAALASLISNSIVTPLWVVRTRLMVASPFYYTTFWDAVSRMSSSPSSFYKGFVPSTVGIIHPMLYFPLYEHLKVWFDSISSFVGVK